MSTFINPNDIRVLTEIDQDIPYGFLLVDHAATRDDLWVVKRFTSADDRSAWLVARGYVAR